MKLRHKDYSDPISESLAQADMALQKLQIDFADDDNALDELHAAYDNLIERIYSSTLTPGADFFGYLHRAALRGSLYGSRV